MLVDSNLSKKSLLVPVPKSQSANFFLSRSGIFGINPEDFAEAHQGGV
jgi:hypothetical protein